MLTVVQHQQLHLPLVVEAVEKEVALVVVLAAQVHLVVVA
jgi:hypothetical protein